MFDVIVVGAGPAGATAALILSRAGARVLLLDRARFPRHKLCGDTLNPGAVDLLTRLGVSESVLHAGIPLLGMRVTGERAASVEARYPGNKAGWAVARSEFDARLVETAVEAGARFEASVVVRHLLVESTAAQPLVRGVVLNGGSSRRTIRLPAPMTIAADGRHSALAFGLGLARHPRAPRRWAVGTYFEAVRDLSSLGEMHVRRGHYLGIAPLPDGLANVCLVTADRRGLDRPLARIMEAIEGDDLLADRFAAARPVAPAVMVGPLAVETQTAGVRGLLLAGDAAGFVDPMTGDGMNLALRGGQLAARVALEAIERPADEAHERLMRLRRREFGAKWRFNRALRALVGSAVGVRAGSTAAALVPGLVRQMIIRAADV